MTIDENKEMFDLSDHNLLVATFNVNTHGDKHFSKKRKQISYLKINDETKEQFLMEIKNNIDENTCIDGKCDQFCQRPNNDENIEMQSIKV